MTPKRKKQNKRQQQTEQDSSASLKLDFYAEIDAEHGLIMWSDNVSDEHEHEQKKRTKPVASKKISDRDYHFSSGK